MEALMDAVGIDPDQPPTGLPGVQHFASMDRLVYLEEDISYRARRVSPSFAVLLHPNEDRIIGFELDGAEAAFGLTCTPRP